MHDSNPGTLTRASSGYGRVFRALVRDPGISTNAKALYALLDDYADEDGGNCYPGQARLADGLGLSVSTIKRALAELRDAGWVVVTARMNARGEHSTNDYRLTREPPGTTDEPRPGVTREPRPGVTREPHTQTSGYPNQGVTQRDTREEDQTTVLDLNGDVLPAKITEREVEVAFVLAEFNATFSRSYRSVPPRVLKALKGWSAEDYRLALAGLASRKPYWGDGPPGWGQLVGRDNVTELEDNRDRGARLVNGSGPPSPAEQLRNATPERRAHAEKMAAIERAGRIT